MKAKTSEERSVVKSTVLSESEMDNDTDHMSISYQETSDTIPNELIQSCCMASD